MGRGRASSDREEPYEVPAFLGREAVHGKKDLVDGLADRHHIADEENSGHRLSVADPAMSKGGHGITIVRQEDSTFTRGPFQDVGVGSGAQPNVLHTNHVEIGASAE